MSDKSLKMSQVADQCRVVAHLAVALSEVHQSYERIFLAGGGAAEDLVDVVGKRTARLMEELGDILNGMDAVTEEDEWTSPIFKRARLAFPTPTDEAPRHER